MSHVLIIGYGNPLRGDDGVGVRAAELLAGEMEKGTKPGKGTAGERGREIPSLPGPRVEVLACHQLTPELAPRVAAADRLILVDARAAGEPGALIEQILAPLSPSGAAGSFTLTHHLDPAGLLAAAQILYGKAPPAVLLTVCGESFDYGETLSPPVAAALPSLLAAIEEWIAETPE